MHLLKDYSGKTVILLILVFALTTFERISKSVNQERTCLCAYDGFGYYMYLPHLFEKGNLKMNKEWAQNLQNKYCDGLQVYQLEKNGKGELIDIYHMGLAIVMTPSYIIGDIGARLFGYETDGFSTPYHITYFLNALLFIFLGLLYLRKLLLLFFKDRTVTFTLLLIYLGTNAYATFDFQYDTPHLYSFSLNAIWLYHLFKFRSTKTKKHIWYSALIFGLTVCIRPTQAMFGLVPFILLIHTFGLGKTFWKNILLFPLGAIIANIPQFLYWSLVGGEFIILNLHTEDIALSDPNIFNFLFSYRKGWLLYTPLFFAIPFGLRYLYIKHKPIFWSITTFLPLYIWVMSSWENWWYASSFSSRVMVDIYPLLALAIAGVVQSLSTKPLRIIGILTLTTISLFNLFQTAQFKRGLINSYRMTKAHYWYVFGKLERPEDYHEKFLIINRYNPDWPEYSKTLPKDKFSLESKVIFTAKDIQTEPGVNYGITRLDLLKLIPTDETEFKVKALVKTSDSTQSTTMHLETVSEWNCYSWNNFEVSLGSSEEDYTQVEYSFTLPHIRHQEDQMQIYLRNVNPIIVEIKEMTITATSLIRK